MYAHARAPALCTNNLLFFSLLFENVCSNICARCILYYGDRGKKQKSNNNNWRTNGKQTMKKKRYWNQWSYVVEPKTDIKKNGKTNHIICTRIISWWAYSFFFICSSKWCAFHRYTVYWTFIFALIHFMHMMRNVLHSLRQYSCQRTLAILQLIFFFFFFIFFLLHRMGDWLVLVNIINWNSITVQYKCISKAYTLWN